MNRPKLFSFTSAQFRPLADIMAASAASDFEVETHFSTLTKALQYQEKAQVIWRALAQQHQAGGQVMIWADADCYFIRPCAQDVLLRMGDLDALFQGDGKGGLATGFFAMRSSNKLLAFWGRVATEKRFYREDCWAGYDEAAVNEWKDQIKWGLLPDAEYFTPCYRTHNTAVHGWTPPSDLVPAAARMIHLSCVYPEDKMRVLQQVIAATRGGG